MQGLPPPRGVGCNVTEGNVTQAVENQTPLSHHGSMPGQNTTTHGAGGGGRAGLLFFWPVGVSLPSLHPVMPPINPLLFPALRHGQPPAPSSPEPGPWLGMGVSLPQSTAPAKHRKSAGTPPLLGPSASPHPWEHRNHLRLCLLQHLGGQGRAGGYCQPTLQPGPGQHCRGDRGLRQPSNPEQAELGGNTGTMATSLLVGMRLSAYHISPRPASWMDRQEGRRSRQLPCGQEFATHSFLQAPPQPAPHWVLGPNPTRFPFPIQCLPCKTTLSPLLIAAGPTNTVCHRHLPAVEHF